MVDAVPSSRRSGSRSRGGSRRRAREPGALLLRTGAGLLALGCGLAALLLAAHHPLAPGALAAGVLLLILVGRYFWMLAPGWALGLLPWLAAAPLTGWLLVEEVDLALLALAAGAYLAICGPHRSAPPPLQAPARQALRWRRSVQLLMALALLSATVALLRGLSHWPSLAIDWFDGYHEQGAALRAAKPVLALLLFLPLWLRVARRRPEQLLPGLMGGALLALLGCILPALWERGALLGTAGWSALHPELRVSGLFWEMHMGGGALDGALALLLPLALLQLLRARSRPALVLAALLLLAGLAVALLRFSLGLALGLGLSLPLLLLSWWGQRRRLAHPAEAGAPRWGARALLAAALLLPGLALLLAVGGGQALERWRREGPDLQQRLQHAQQVLAPLEARGDWLLGVGAGRFVSVFAESAHGEDRIGDYRLRPGEPPALWLRGGMHALGPGELLRLSQRLPAAPDGLRLRLNARHDAPQQLQVEVCSRQGVNATGCRSAQLALPPSPGRWTSHELRLPDGAAQPLAAPTLSLALLTRGGELELSQLSLQGADGRELLRNGDFRADLARWFPSSDRHHLPWHAKSLPLHLLFEQGILGLALAGLLVAGAVARLGLGEAREHPLAPALLAALVGFAVVGLFDSLVDAPRIAFLALTLLVLALGLRTPPPSS
jgi:hypothetical protein